MSQIIYMQLSKSVDLSYEFNWLVITGISMKKYLISTLLLKKQSVMLESIKYKLKRSSTMAISIFNITANDVKIFNKNKKTQTTYVHKTKYKLFTSRKF